VILGQLRKEIEPQRRREASITSTAPRLVGGVRRRKPLPRSSWMNCAESRSQHTQVDLAGHHIDAPCCRGRAVASVAPATARPSTEAYALWDMTRLAERILGLREKT
jgi:hypothetical protein